MALDVTTVANGVSMSPNTNCWRLVFNMTTKRAMHLFESTGVTATKNGLYCGETKQACLDYAAAQNITISAKLLADTDPAND